ncbi:MAG: hypothetical protein AVDCRST_MAG79-257 [uncultured Thermoleophilia bacterium]|uniref:Glycosyltransferase RgtA/B/C/D-like domain-containing protein n=1 Tax=uncultured Thermoleophilia bacterium TaxID=1497501 RepID=A0A6J4TGK7_9ACTN|nr:MAG: hypothetical protein AVDCRST_MAG79-257 [uncultured Thermoleophilia bacterium]
MSSRAWWAAGLLIVVLSLGLRVAYVEATPRAQPIHDAFDYDGHARSIAATGAFSPTLAHRRPSAFRPPGYPYLLGAVYRLTDVREAAVERRFHVGQLLGAVIGALTVGMIGLLAAQLWGGLVAVVAAALAAVYVPLVTVGTAVMSEGLSTLVSLAALAAALQHRRSGHRWRWALLAGLLAGLAVLTRPNAAVLLLPLGLAVWTGRPRLSRSALGPPAALVAVAVLAVAPWTIRNAVVLDTFVPVTTQLGSAMAGTYNDDSRRDGDNPWSWRSIDHVAAYEDLAARVSKIPEAELERRVRERAIDYIRDRPVSVAEVGFWNTIRMFELAGLQRARETSATISIPGGPAIAGVFCFWLFALLAVAGAFTARARAAPLLVWLVPVLFAASVVFLTLETPRYRTAVEPFVVLLAALAVTAAIERRRQRGRHLGDAEPAGERARTPAPARR